MWNAERGFGFITPDAGGDRFVHISNCAEDIEALRKGDRVSFDERQSKKFAGQLEAYAVALID